MFAGRNGDVNVEALMRWAGAIGQAPQENAGNGGKDELCAFREFRRFSTHMVTKGAEDWWTNTVQRFDEEEDVCGKEEVRFLELKRGKGQYRGESYGNKKKQKSGYGKKPSGRGASNLIELYRCGNQGHKLVDCGIDSSRICYSCGEQVHISAMCDKLKKGQAKAKVFVLSGDEDTAKDRLIREQPSFNSLDCAMRSDLVLADMRKSLVIDTFAMSYVFISSCQDDDVWRMIYGNHSCLAIYVDKMFLFCCGICMC
ncbi:uncharacterized protein LOC131641404 [Vicia villosa]|uniref:uncharacterized protein LOC131641404 n=1 Tax=Vicia villosa TaxID=3911 RepID=UPI00273B35C7|nr:uncharacterized protein LOC131641404 [Vicia villosa]